MRKLIVALASFAAIAGSPAAWSQSWTPGGLLQFLQDASYNLSLEFPAVNQFDSATLVVAYSPQVFSPLSSASFSSGLFAISSGDVSAPAPSAIHSGLDEVVLSMPIGSPINLSAGVLLLTMNLAVKPTAALGPTTVFNNLEYSIFSSNDPTVLDLEINANINAVPEPQTWALMGVSLLLIGAAVARRKGRRETMR